MDRSCTILVRIDIDIARIRLKVRVFFINFRDFYLWIWYQSVIRGSIFHVRIDMHYEHLKVKVETLSKIISIEGTKIYFTLTNSQYFLLFINFTKIYFETQRSILHVQIDMHYEHLKVKVETLSKIILIEGTKIYFYKLLTFPAFHQFY